MSGHHERVLLTIGKGRRVDEGERTFVRATRLYRDRWGEPIKVFYNVTGSATEGVDFEIYDENRKGYLTGDKYHNTLYIRVFDDEILEGDETIKISISSDAPDASYLNQVSTFVIKGDPPQKPVLKSAIEVPKDPKDLFTLGNLSIHFGGNGADTKTVASGDAFFARNGVDRLSAGLNKEVRIDGKKWKIPALLSGGSNTDIYTISRGQSVIIADKSYLGSAWDTGSDKLIISGTGGDLTAYSVENRHILLADDSGTSALILEGLNGKGFIERLQFSTKDGEVGLRLDIGSVKSSLIDFNYSWETLLEEGIFKPSVIGIGDDPDSIRKEVQKLRDLDNQAILAHLKTDYAYEYEFTGGAGVDLVEGFNDDKFGNDWFRGGDGDDQLTGFRGADVLDGGNGNDLLKAGNGRDVISGGHGADTMYGGFGLNTFEDELDGEIDQLYFRSDQWAENWLYGTAGNSPNGEKADKIEMLDEFDQIYVQGIETSQLSYGFVDHNSNLGETLSGIGIYASGVLEAVYVGNNLSIGQLDSMTQGTI